MGTTLATSLRFVTTAATDLPPSLRQTVIMSQNTIGIENQRPQPAGESHGGLARHGQPQSGQTPTYASGQASGHNDATIHDALVPVLEELNVNGPKKVVRFEKLESDLRNDGKGPPPADEDRLFERERSLSLQYLLVNVAEFRELTEIRKKVNDNQSVATYAHGLLTL